MSKSTPISQKKRKLEDGMKGRTAKPWKRVRKQQEYHSSSDSEGSEDISEAGFVPVNLADSDDDISTRTKPARSKSMERLSSTTDLQNLDGESAAILGEDENEDEDDDDDDDDEGGSDTVATGSNVKKLHKTSKRNDPEAFSTSISKILSTKLSQAARKDPVLSRSRDAVETSVSIANERLEQRVRAKIRAERKEDLQRGRTKDVLGVSTGQTGEVAEEEKKLRKIAQRGVVKLFNAVRAAQVRGEQALREEKKKGTVGPANRAERVNEMSKQGFLELISGKKGQLVQPT